MRYPEPGDNIFLDKFLGFHISNVRQGFSFDPFGEIICANQQISLVTCCFGKRAINIQAHCTNGQGLDRGLRTPLGWCMFGADLWH